MVILIILASVKRDMRVRSQNQANIKYFIDDIVIDVSSSINFKHRRYKKEI